MVKYEYQEFSLPHGPERAREFVLAALNELGAQGWQAISIKENHLFFRAGPDGKQMPIDGIRVLCQRPAAEHAPEKKLRKE